MRVWSEAWSRVGEMRVNAHRWTIVVWANTRSMHLVRLDRRTIGLAPHESELIVKLAKLIHLDALKCALLHFPPKPEAGNDRR